MDGCKPLPPVRQSAGVEKLHSLRRLRPGPHAKPLVRYQLNLSVFDVFSCDDLSGLRDIAAQVELI